jgi:hypothetical protein
MLIFLYLFLNRDIHTETRTHTSVADPKIRIGFNADPDQGSQTNADPNGSVS